MIIGCQNIFYLTQFLQKVLLLQPQKPNNVWITIITLTKARWPNDFSGTAKECIYVIACLKGITKHNKIRRRLKITNGQSCWISSKFKRKHAQLWPAQILGPPNIDSQHYTHKHWQFVCLFTPRGVPRRTRGRRGRQYDTESTASSILRLVFSFARVESKVVLFRCASQQAAIVAETTSSVTAVIVTC